MSLYPSLEDLKVDKVIKAQAQFAHTTTTTSTSTTMPAISEVGHQLQQPATAGMPSSSLYPNLEELGEYMGLSLNSDEVQNNLALLPVANNVAVPSYSGVAGMVCPVTGSDMGIRRAEVRQGLREIILCKDQDGKVGLRLRAIDNGVFVQLVQANSPAALAGLRFGDQVLQINGHNCAGWSVDKAHKALKAAADTRIDMVVRDRPFQRTITMHKDSSGHVGFIYKSGKITSLVKDGSAARNGLLTEHYICEINGQNVIGLKDSQIKDILSSSPTAMTITIMPKFIYEHMIKRMSSSLLKSAMDHSIPEV
ncbi:syntenin-2 isoform X2 [Dunckerocampus dactyliophorus]|uniref:syntenin-2 isoform X2 n=1 Tax=Dunckerocampus dactyliophorus TaxID=161453 RepID=UPI00240702BE|nr:syntenin-2 isoform X2 [Dunckerocampus dactyliophorus]